MNGKSQLLNLYRQFFKATQNCKDKHLKFYVRRRIREDYEEKSKLDQVQMSKFVEEAKADLEVIKRQVAVRNLYL